MCVNFVYKRDNVNIIQDYQKELNKPQKCMISSSLPHGRLYTTKSMTLASGAVFLSKICLSVCNMTPKRTDMRNLSGIFFVFPYFYTKADEPAPVEVHVKVKFKSLATSYLFTFRPVWFTSSKAHTHKLKTKTLHSQMKLQGKGSIGQEPAEVRYENIVMDRTDIQRETWEDLLMDTWNLIRSRPFQYMVGSISWNESRLSFGIRQTRILSRSLDPVDFLVDEKCIGITPIGYHDQLERI